MSIEAAARFLTLAVNDPEVAEEYFKLGWAEYFQLGTEEVTDPKDDDGAGSEASNIVDAFPGLSANEKAILKTKNLQLILDYLRGELPPKPATDVPPPDPPGGT